MAPLDAVRELVSAAGVAGRGPRTVVGLLTASPYDLATLIRDSGVDRRTVEALLSTLDSDLVWTGDRARIRPERADAYRAAFDIAQLGRTEPADPFAARLAAAADVVDRIAAVRAAAPRPRAALDHVPATAATVVRRALWLDATFDLDGARVLCLGDHDLTSLALAAVHPTVAVSVVDVDDGVLRTIDRAATRPVDCRYADLRHGLPPAVLAWADLVVTDPPYTPAGVRLFLARGLAALRDRAHGRLVLAYGFGPDHPGLGLKVQQGIAALHLVYEAVLPAFHRYDGAQALGGRSDLYVLRPTARSARTAERESGRPGIYTHGPQALEAAGDTLAGPSARAAVAAAGPPRPPDTPGPPDTPASSGPPDTPGPSGPRATPGPSGPPAPPATAGPPAPPATAGPPAAGPAGLAVTALIGDGWPTGDGWLTGNDRATGDGPGPVRAGLAATLAAGLPAAVSRTGGAVAVNLTADPGGWLLRLLLAVDAPRVAVLVPSRHPDLATDRATRELADLVGPKYRLSVAGPTPDGRHAVVVAGRVDPAGLPGPGRVVRWLLDRPHATVAGGWRDALVKTSRRVGPTALTRNEARAVVERSVPDRYLLDERLIDLPRHRLVAVVRAAAATGPD
jgi:hypothetical protein